MPAVEQGADDGMKIMGSLTANPAVRCPSRLFVWQRHHFAEGIANVIGGDDNDTPAREMGGQERRLLSQSRIAMGEGDQRAGRLDRCEIRGCPVA